MNDVIALTSQSQIDAKNNNNVVDDDDEVHEENKQ